MSIDPDAVEDVVEQAQEEYEKKTLLGEDLARNFDQHIRTEECSSTVKIHAESFKRKLHPTAVSKMVDDIQDCEASKFLSGLQSKTNDTEDLSQDFVSELIKHVDKYRGIRVYLPNKTEYRSELNRHQMLETIGATRNASLHWFRPEYYDYDRGFLVDDGVYVKQKQQGKAPVIAGNMNTSLSGDYSDNWLQIHLRRVSGGKIEVDFQTEFSRPQLIDERASIVQFDLPDPQSL